LTTAFGASASLTFNGTAIWIYGARRDNHARFNTTLDGTAYFDDGYSSVNLFQEVLFAGLQLDSGTLHTVSIVDSVVDANRPYLDIDSVCIGSGPILFYFVPSHGGVAVFIALTRWSVDRL